MWYTVDMTLVLPKPYLSYSQIDLWLRSPVQYKKRYFENQQTPTTPELRFGSHIGKLLEDNHKSVSHIRRFDIPEQPLNVTIDGVPFMGFIDTFDSMKKQIGEYKTGVVPWTQERVNTHKQLDLYSLAVQELFGSVHETCYLVWLPTRKVKPKTKGLISHEDSHSIELTGEVVEFERIITQDERDFARKLLVRVANEISEAYQEYNSVGELSTPTIES